MRTDLGKSFLHNPHYYLQTQIYIGYTVDKTNYTSTEIIVL